MQPSRFNSLSDSWARVELCEAPIYLDCRVKVIQVPSLWTNTAISINSFKGTFATGQTAFLFITDASGAVNSEGFPITLQ